MFVDIVADFARQHSKGDFSVPRRSHIWSTLDHDDVSLARLQRCLAVASLPYQRRFRLWCSYSDTAKTLERSSRKGVVEVMVCVLAMEEEDEESKQTEHTSLVSAPSIQICNTHSDKP